MGFFRYIWSIYIFFWWWCCLLVLDSVTSTPQWIRRTRPREKKKGCLGGLALMIRKNSMVLGRSWPTPHTTPLFLPPEDPSPVLLRPNSIPEWREEPHPPNRTCPCRQAPLKELITDNEIETIAHLMRNDYITFEQHLFIVELNHDLKKRDWIYWPWYGDTTILRSNINRFLIFIWIYHVVCFRKSRHFKYKTFPTL